MDPEFPCSITIDLPLPTHRLASSALRAIQVDTELSPLVRRSFNLATGPKLPSQTLSSSDPRETELMNEIASRNSGNQGGEEASKTVLQVTYEATTNRMLRVAVNAFMDTLGVVLDVMEELDVHILEQELGQ